MGKGAGIKKHPFHCFGSNLEEVFRLLFQVIHLECTIWATALLQGSAKECSADDACIVSECSGFNR